MKGPFYPIRLSYKVPQLHVKSLSKYITDWSTANLTGWWYFEFNTIYRNYNSTERELQVFGITELKNDADKVEQFFLAKNEQNIIHYFEFKLNMPDIEKIVYLKYLSYWLEKNTSGLHYCDSDFNAKVANPDLQVYVGFGNLDDALLFKLSWL